MDGEKNVVGDIEEDKGSNSGSGSTTSHSSEEFVKVNQDDASLEDASGNTPREDVEDIPTLPGFGAVADLIHWRDIKNTLIVFSFLLVVSLSLSCYSVISVFAYVGLSLLTVTVAVRLYKLVLQTLNGTQQPHPFQEFLDTDVTLSPERIKKYTDSISSHLNCAVTTGRDLILVKNTTSSLKFGVFLWLMTYLGAAFNGLTLFIIGFVLLFTVPPVYEKYQTQIDGYCGIGHDKLQDIMEKVKAKFPGKKQPKPKAQ